MILKVICQHCDNEVLPGHRVCDRCGAPRTASLLKAPELEKGYRLYQNAWRGFAVMFPEGWSTLTAEGAGVSFRSPDGEAELELMLLPPQTMVSAPEQAELFLNRFGPCQTEMLPDSTEHYARFLFENPYWRGILSVHLTERGGTLAVARSHPSCPLDLEPPLQKMLSSLSPIETISRQRWNEPNENSFQIDCPTGWQTQSAIPPAVTGVGMRQPIFRMSADPSGQILLVREPEFRPFINQEPPPQPAKEEGFFQKLGRYAKQFEHSMASAFGEVICPFRGLRPAVDLFFMPHWERTLPGCKMIAFEDHARADSADVHLLLPGDIIRVVRLQGISLPDPTGTMPHRWLAGHSHFYQAPATLMEKFEPIFVGIVQSFRTVPQWQQRERGRAQQAQQTQMIQQQHDQQQWMAHSQAMHHQRMNDIQMQGQAAQRSHQGFQAISDLQMQGWQSSQVSSDVVQHHTINGVQERDDFLNINTGNVHNLCSHVNNYWDTGQDFVVGSDLQLQVPPDWTPLQRYDGPPR